MGQVWTGQATTVRAIGAGRLIERLGHSRPSRVILLCAIIVTLSLLDLYLTLMYVTLTGMHETNPLAREVMEHGSPALLVAWKLATVALCVGILLWTRRTRTGELGAWVGLGVLAALTLHWGAFAQQNTRLAELREMAEQNDIHIATYYDERWVEMRPGGQRTP